MLGQVSVASTVPALVRTTPPSPATNALPVSEGSRTSACRSGWLPFMRTGPMLPPTSVAGSWAPTVMSSQVDPPSVERTTVRPNDAPAVAGVSLMGGISFHWATPPIHTTSGSPGSVRTTRSYEHCGLQIFAPPKPGSAGSALLTVCQPASIVAAGSPAASLRIAMPPSSPTTA